LGVSHEAKNNNKYNNKIKSPNRLLSCFSMQVQHIDQQKAARFESDFCVRSASCIATLETMPAKFH